MPENESLELPEEPVEALEDDEALEELVEPDPLDEAAPEPDEAEVEDEEPTEAPEAPPGAVTHVGEEWSPSSDALNPAFAVPADDGQAGGVDED